MKVALDTNFRYIVRGGITRYIDCLLQAFASLHLPDFEWQELNWPVTNYEYQQPIRALKTIYREFVWTPFIGPRQLEQSRADIFHSLDFSRVARVKCPNILTLQDLGFIRVPDRYRPWAKFRSRGYLRQCQTVDKVICISHFTADEAMKLLGVPASRIVITQLGCGFADPILGIKSEAPAQSLPPEFFLFVGHLEPNKNLKLLRGVYELAENSGRILPPLVIVGKRWEGVHHEGPPPKNWIFLGRQSDETLRYLYERAIAHIFPSRYEGFGLTLLESMSYGCPVICSPVASLPEVAGDAALFVPPTAEAYYKACIQLLDNSSQRDEWRNRGFTRTKLFSWRKCAEETVQVYRDLLRT